MKLAPRYDAPAIISSDGAPDDQLAPATRQLNRLAATLADFGDAEWNEPTRCAGWTVHDVIAHLVSVNNFWRASVLAGLAGEPTRILDQFDPAATPPLLVEPMRALAPSAVLDQFVAANQGYLEVLATLDDNGWMTPVETPAGHVPVRMLTAHGLWDAWIHERDIALPLGLQPPAEDDEVLASLRYAAALSPALAITAGRPLVGVFAVETTGPASSFRLEVGDSVAVRDGAVPADAPRLRGDAVELVEALSIRAQLPDTAPPEWRALLSGLAAAFDTSV